MKIITSIFLIMLCASCNEGEHSENIAPQTNFNQYTEVERDSIAEGYNKWANYFLQPSFAYRMYKDSANMAQPNKVEYLQTLSYSYKKRGEHIRAMELLNEVVEKDVKESSVNALQYRAWTLLYYYRDYQGALDDINLIEQMSNDNYSQCWGEPCSFQKAQALYKLNRYEESIAVMQNLIDIEVERYNEASNPMYYLYLGRCFQHLGKLNGALNAYNKSLTYYPKSCEGHYFLGETYELKGDLRKAKLAYENALKFKNYKMNEPYIERFDEVFAFQVKKKLGRLEGQTKQ
jgi:tetratricopeptide (TPR) repeat protein